VADFKAAVEGAEPLRDSRTYFTPGAPAEELMRALWHMVLGTFIAFATAAHEAPDDRSSRTRRESTFVRGRPERFPRFAAALMPARTRSLISDRSNSATAART
jgi:hypothetical protein